MIEPGISPENVLDQTEVKKIAIVPLTSEERSLVRKTFHTGYGQMLVNGGNDIFYAHFLADFNISVTDHPEFVAGVGIKHKRVHLYLGRNLLNYKPKEVVAILRHEVLHVLFQHFSRRGERIHELFNVACDIAINQFIKDLPPDACDLSTGSKAGMEPMLAFQTAEYYYNELIRRGIKVRHVFDSHDWDDGIGELTKDELHELDLNIKAMQERARHKSRGNLTSDMEQLLNLTGGNTRVSWQTALRRGTGKRSKQRVETIKKRNKRYPKRIEMRGYKRKMSSDLLIVLDVSGSVADEDVIRGLGAVRSVCAQTGAVASILQIDTEVKGVSEINANSRQFIRRASGGTHLYPAISYINENKMKPDMILVMTDGCIESTWETPPRTQVMFLLFNQGDTLHLDTSNFPKSPLVYHLNE